ncbi:MAG: DUF6151 family protein [Candidatus Devosia phytovorans]|uniref:DUF6151 family protein n=1 Tax=Candidatus Devosia phytovorans TaxID=3121372 RepID=A0AAJ6B2B5_9HYPH|nr:DUF6151 family protein [Devosia sp.]WEK05378.1 MAG: DUF6151 family protein [Devosia sp.]
MSVIGCQCGKVRIEITGAPIIVAECHCNSCRDGAGRMEGLEGAPRVIGSGDGSHYVLYRKDRVQIVAGEEWLRNFRLSPKSPTRRVFAACCNTPVFTEFKGGHWLSLYANLWQGHDVPALDIRTQTGDAPAGSVPEDGVPTGGWETVKFYGRLLGAWIAMGFKQPPVAPDMVEVQLERR